MRRIFVGDIQGCRQQLEDLLTALEFVPGVDELFPVGDLVNKGPDSEGVLRILMDLGSQPVLGNHDLLWLETGRLRVSAQEEWLRAQPCVRVMNDLIVVHAGLHPKWSEEHLTSLSEAEIRFAVTVRYCDANGDLPTADWPPPEPPFGPWHEFYRGEKRVVFGHWARQGLVHTARVVGLDTGCVYGGKLTAWIAEEDRIVQVDGLAGPR